MNLKLTTLTFISSAISLLGQTTVTFIEEDFEDPGGTSIFVQNNNATATIADDPAAGGAQGKVMAVDVGGGGNEWGAVNTVPETIDIPAGVEPGVAAYSISMNVYVPSDTGFNGVDDSSDRIGLIVRWNGLSGDSSTFLNFSDFTPDTWVPFEHTGIVPITGNDGLPPSKVVSIISFHDRGNDAADGVAAYFDDYKFDVDVSDDDPNLNLGTALSFGDVEQNGGPVTKALNLDNSGATQTLTITGITLSGTNADLFSIDELTFPIDIAPGANEQVTLTLDPLDNMGGLFAQIDIASNDSSSANLQINLDANSVEPFDGTEFILNNSFEELIEGTTDLVSWRNNARFTSSTDFARTGTTSGVFNLAGGQQWGEARFEHLDADLPDSVPITSNMYGREYFYSAWYLKPATGALADDDNLRAIFRWNGLNGATNHVPGGIIPVGSLPDEIWTRVSGLGVIPEVDLDGLPVTHLTILWSHEDTGADGVGGELMYLDDISLKIDVPPIVPSGPPVITDIAHDLANDIVTLTYEGIADATYAIDRSTGLTAEGQADGWIELSDSENSAETTRTYTDFGAPSTGEKLFYRVRLAN
ncbi:hypothetical protein N9133_02515 [Akkermansiaceae bacterium]|nr:hypothetical protein [Akkermansiaceae bacterium]MDB4458227.1 hypothetical protein [Akkermansiaceae bacterium]MDB4462533.1 hypothetical protein [Akkermansiaceae bacterium]